jgi:hypothetical protein
MMLEWLGDDALNGPHADVGTALFQKPLHHHGVPAGRPFVERPRLIPRRVGQSPRRR